MRESAIIAGHSVLCAATGDDATCPGPSEEKDPADLHVTDPRRQRYEDEQGEAWWSANIGHED